MTARLLGVLAALAVFAAAWFGWSWWRTAHDDVVTRARDRDAVLSAASDGLVALNTIDYRAAGPSVDRWTQVTTGQLGQTISGDRQSQLDRATATRTEATATLDEAAVAELGGNTARVIAVLDVRLSTNGSAPSSSRSRLNAELTRTPQGWKIDSVQAAA
jgi:Mce-associated membrane protein